VHFRGASVASLRIDERSLTLEDNGAALPTDDAFWTTLGVRDASPKWSTAPSAVELAIVASVSDYFVARTANGTLAFERRMPAAADDLPAGAGTNVIVLTLSADVFRNSIQPGPSALFGWTRDFAATFPGVTIHLEQGRRGRRTFSYPAGLGDLVAELDYGRSILQPEVLCFSSHGQPGTVSVALRFCRTGPQQIVTFVNHERTPDNGAHADGFLSGVREALGKNYTKAALTACVAVEWPRPQWDGSLKERLADAALGENVYRLVSEHRAQVREANDEAGAG
jgi:DNA gyrase/topoisomerase IV subunit B